MPYFRPEALEPDGRLERVTSCYGTYTVDVNIKREMVLSPHDEEVASSKDTNNTLFKAKMVKTDTLFQTKRAKKTIPFGAAHTYIAYIRESPPPPSPKRKTRCRL